MHTKDKTKNILRVFLKICYICKTIWSHITAGNKHILFPPPVYYKVKHLPFDFAWDSAVIYFIAYSSSLALFCWRIKIFWSICYDLKHTTLFSNITSNIANHPWIDARFEDISYVSLSGGIELNVQRVPPCGEHIKMLDKQ